MYHCGCRNPASSLGNLAKKHMPHTALLAGKRASPTTTKKSTRSDTQKKKRSEHLDHQKRRQRRQSRRGAAAALVMPSCSSLVGLLLAGRHYHSWPLAIFFSLSLGRAGYPVTSERGGDGGGMVSHAQRAATLRGGGRHGQPYGVHWEKYENTRK